MGSVPAAGAAGGAYPEPGSPAPAGAGPMSREADAEEEDPDRSGPRISVIVGLVLLGATLLVLLAIGAVYGLSQLSRSSTPDYAVGQCVIQDGTSADLADCDQPGAFEIVSEVDTREECPDQAQPAIEVPGSPVRVFCLVPAGEAGGDPGAGQTAAPEDLPSQSPAAEEPADGEDADE